MTTCTYTIGYGDKYLKKRFLVLLFLKGGNESLPFLVYTKNLTFFENLIKTAIFAHYAHRR